MVLFQQGTATEKPIGSEVQIETLPEIYPARGVSETDTAWNARVATWNARTRTITFTTLAGVKQTTAALAFNATAATIETAVAALAGIGAGNIKVSGSGRTFEYAFTGTLANKGMNRMNNTRTDSGIKSYFETVVQGYSENVQRLVKEDNTRRAIEGVVGPDNLTNSGNTALNSPQDIGNPARYSGTGRQYVGTVTATGGTRAFTVSSPSAGTQTTGAIAFNATATAIQTALEALSNVAPGDVIVSGTGGSYTYDWMGAFLGPNNITFTVDPALLTGGTATLVLTKEGTVSYPLYR